MEDPTGAGLFPESFFGAVHPKYRTPWKATILTGVAVAIGAALLPLRALADSFHAEPQRQTAPLRARVRWLPA